MLTLLLAAMFLACFSVQAQEEEKSLSLETIFQSGKLYPRGVRGIRSMNDGEHFTQIKRDSINAYSYKTGELTGVIVTSDDLIPVGDTTPISLYNYTFSTDESKILFADETEAIYRRSSKSFFYVFDRDTKTLTPVSEYGKQQLAAFSPDNSKVAFVRENNIFIKNLNEGTEIQITFDGEDRHIINGTTDWVYEEEFAVTKGFYWSPDGTNIAFMKFDESQVKEWWLTYYGELYPDIHKYKYPKAGEANSVVTVHVYNLEKGTTKKMDTGAETDQYIPRIKWNPAGEVVILRVNRLQNMLEILLADAATGDSEVIYSETNKYYIEDGNYDNIHFLDNGKQIILTSEKSGFNHIYLYNIEKQELNPVTKGEWEVTSLLGVDEDGKKVYYQSAEVSPLERNVYVINFNGKGKKVLAPKEGINSARFSEDYKYFINTWSDANTPPVYTVNLGKNGDLVRVLEDNERLRELREEYSLQPREFFTITTSEGIELNAWRILPADFDPAKKYPVLFDIYGGPGSQTVRNSYGSGELWGQYLAQEGIIVVSVDGRGTGGRGEEFKKMTYQELGKFETIDLIEAGKYMADLPYTDENKIGVFGWSYGGYMSTLAMTKGADVFDVGIAVAPVTNWRYYDNIYTERFMRTPQENPSGYDENSPIFYVDQLKGKYLLIHGMTDDNVHPQNTYDLITALVAADKDFELMLYPNSNHGIYTGKNTTIHLYRKMTGFLMENLK